VRADWSLISRGNSLSLRLAPSRPRSCLAVLQSGPIWTAGTAPSEHLGYFKEIVSTDTHGQRCERSHPRAWCSSASRALVALHSAGSLADAVPS
jgi:hypothetical protein